MKISANGIDVADVQAQQLATDQAAVAAQAANIREGASVLDQTGTYTQSIYIPYPGYYGDVQHLSGSLGIDILYSQIVLEDCHFDNFWVYPDDYYLGETWGYWGVQQNTYNNSANSLDVGIGISNSADLILDLSNMGAQVCYFYFYYSSGYDFVLDLSYNALSGGSDSDEGYHGTVSGIINDCYNYAYLSHGLSASQLYLNDQVDGAIEVGSQTDSYGEALAAAGWTIQYDTYMPEPP